jgi:hypothetical protein
MRIARKLALLCLVAIAAMAFAASTASADEAITVSNEETGAACNPCVLHVVGESRLDAFHVVAVSSCRDEFKATILNNGTGSIFHDGTGTDSASPGCTREQCENDDGTEEPWNFRSEEIGPNTVELNVAFCLSPVDMSAKGHCANLIIPVTEEGTAPEDHRYMFDVNTECTISGTPVEIEGHWDAETVHTPANENEVEFVHQP